MNKETDTQENTAQHIKDGKIDFPILFDAKNTNVTNYGVTEFPRLFLIGKDRRVLWQGTGLGSELKEYLSRQAVKE